MLVHILLKDGVGFVSNEERPSILDVHGGVVGHADVTRDFRVVEDATKVDDRVVKLQIGEEHFTAQVHPIYVRMLL